MWRSSPPPAGPHANCTWRRRVVSVVHCRGKARSRRTCHHTLAPLESTSLNSSVFTGSAPRIAKRNA